MLCAPSRSRLLRRLNSNPIRNSQRSLPNTGVSLGLPLLKLTALPATPARPNLRRSADCQELEPPAPDSQARKDEDEEIEPRTFTVAEAQSLIASGEIVDLKTVAGLTMI